MLSGYLRSRAEGLENGSWKSVEAELKNIDRIGRVSAELPRPPPSPTPAYIIADGISLYTIVVLTGSEGQTLSLSLVSTYDWS